MPVLDYEVNIFRFYNEISLWDLMSNVKNISLKSFFLQNQILICCMHDFSPMPPLDCMIFFLPHKHVYKKPKQVQKELYNIFCFFGYYN